MVTENILLLWGKKRKKISFTLFLFFFFFFNGLQNINLHCMHRKSLRHFSNIFCVKKVIGFLNDMRVTKLWQNFQLWVNCPLNVALSWRCSKLARKALFLLFLFLFLMAVPLNSCQQTPGNWEIFNAWWATIERSVLLWTCVRTYTACFSRCGMSF